jgi:mevalonate kinase
MTTTRPAPGKTHLFDEHAAVHAAEAIASEINLRTTATVAESNQTMSGEQ